VEFLLLEAECHHERYLVDEKQNPEVNHLDDEPHMAFGLGLSAGHTILTAEHCHDINEDADSEQSGYHSNVPNLHQVDADAHNGEQDGGADPFYHVEDACKLDCEIVDCASISLANNNVSIDTRCHPGSIRVEIAGGNTANELNYVVESDDGAEHAELLVEESGHHVGLQVLLLLEHSWLFVSLDFLRCACLVDRLVDAFLSLHC